MTEPARPPGTDPAAPHSDGPHDARPDHGGWAGSSVPAVRPTSPPSGPWAPSPVPGWGAPPADPGWGPPAVPGPPAPPPPSRVVSRPPRRVDPIAGTPFGVVHLDVPPVASGLAVGSLVGGVASIVVSLLVICFGVVGGEPGWVWAAGAFTLLGTLTGAGAAAAGLLALRQIRRPVAPPAVRFTGRGLALAGVSCGSAGVLLSLLGLGLALLVTLV